MFDVQGALRRAPLTLLQVVRTGPRHDPASGNARRRPWPPFSGDLETRQSKFRVNPAILAADWSATFINEANTTLGTGHGVVPRVGLLPVPSVSFRLPPSAHGNLGSTFDAEWWDGDTILVPSPSPDTRSRVAIMRDSAPNQLHRFTYGSGLVPRPREGASARCRSVSPLAGAL